MPHPVGEPGEFGSGWLGLDRVLRRALTTQQGAIFIIQAERFFDRGAGMQRALVVGMSLVCLGIVGKVGGWVSPGEERAVWSMAVAAEPTRLDPVVVTGTQISVPVSELPSAITVIEREEIESRQITDVQQLLRTAPGLSVTQTGSRGGAYRCVSTWGECQFQPGAGGRRAGE
jgi:hypothetical protein